MSGAASSSASGKLGTVSKLKPPAKAPVKLSSAIATSLSPLLGDEDDRRLFEREFADVRPLPPGPSRVPPATRRDGKATLPAVRVRAPSRQSPAASQDRLKVEQIGLRVTAQANGISRRVLQSLARGETAIEAICDLHGKQRDAAERQLDAFIARSLARGLRCVLVICGRGLHSGPTGPVLLELAIDLLGRGPLASEVLAFTTAPADRGGEGALVVLLRNRTKG